MATVFMKWLETQPEQYDRGIQLLTLGKLHKLQDRLVGLLIQPGTRVLEIGCGTGALTVAMAAKGAEVVGIDLNAGMLAQAENRTAALGLDEHVVLEHMDAALIAERFKPGSFDLIVSSLALSELSRDSQAYVLSACRSLLAPGGRLAILDEITPSGWIARLAVGMVHLPLRFITWLLTRTTTRPLHNFREALERTGFRSAIVACELMGSLCVFLAEPKPDEGAHPLPVSFKGRLRHRLSLRNLLIDLWAIFFRIMPPYPKVAPGLYSIGQPTPDSPVLVTGNFDLTVRRLVKAIDHKLHAWLLVVDSGGINVWCAAGGGFLTAERVIGALSVSRLDEVVNHRALILPQLCASGVDGWAIRKQTKWGVHWGPVRATDLPAYIRAGRKKTDEMRHVRFPLRDRLEMLAATMGFYGLMILIPVALIWPASFWPLLAAMLGLSLFYAITLPWLPGQDGLAKSLPLAVIALAGMLVYSWYVHSTALTDIFNRLVGLTGLSVFVGAELQGMSPKMRGEQANWGWEVIIAVFLALAYWLIPRLLGWR
jgi:ubiquinone/menaquinone biosynthesis C-methylase UbiE